MSSKYSTYASLCTETPSDAAAFDRWLDERINDKELRAEALKEASQTDADLPAQDYRRLAMASGKYDGDIQPGQIRILSKRFTADPDVIPYVVVLERWSEGMWLVAPFSQYATPAIPGEMESGINAHGQRVIQAWNGRTIQDRLLEKSFLCGKMEESTREQVMALFRHEFGGTDLPGSFSARRGPSITMAADPRREYVAETISRLRPLSTAVKATERYTEDQLCEKLKDSFIPCGFGERLSAVAAKSQMQMIETHTIGDNELALIYSPEERAIYLKVYGKNDELTDACDGFALLSDGGEFLGVISDGMLEAPFEKILHSFRITDADGNPVLEAKD